MTAKEFRRLIVQQALAGAVVEPRCPHTQECGGCTFQDRVYADQVAAKSAALTRIWAEAELPEQVRPAGPIEVVPSPSPYAYRTRMDYVASRGRFGLRRSGRFNYIVELGTCELIPPAGFAIAHTLWAALRDMGLPDYDRIKHSGFLRYLVVRRSPTDQFLLAAVTSAGPYEREMEQVAQLALGQPGVLGFHWLLNDTKTDLSSGTPLRHWGAATLPMQVGSTTLQIGPNTFFQNNVHLLEPLLEEVRGWILRLRSGQAMDDGRWTVDRGRIAAVADLYGGVGTIALQLAPFVERVVCVEAVGESVALARQNITANGVANVEAVESEVAPFLRGQAVAAWDLVVADPPRTGLGPEVCSELLRIAPRRIIYVSCNPLTQLDDLRMLGSAYRLRVLRGYDMFPQTPHIEALAVLDRIGM